LKFCLLRFGFSSAVHIESSSSFFVLDVLPIRLSSLIFQLFSSDSGLDEFPSKPTQVPMLQHLLPSRLSERPAPALLFSSALSQGQQGDEPASMGASIFQPISLPRRARSRACAGVAPGASGLLEEAEACISEDSTS
jgi:hypothetical protein